MLDAWQGGSRGPPESSWRYPGWRVVAVCVVMAVYAWGFGFYGQGFYLAELTATRGWPTALVAAGTTAFYLISAILGAFVGDVMGRFGARAVVLTGIVLMGSAASLVPIAAQPWQLFAAFGLMSFGWAAISLTAITTIIGAWFGHKRGLAISIGLTGASFGGIIVVPLLAILDRRIGFGPAVWSVASGLGVLVFLSAFLVLRSSPFAAARGSAMPSSGAQRGALLRSGAFWSVSAPFAMAFFAQVGFLTHQIALLEPQAGREAAGLAVAVTTGAAVCGRLVLGAVVDRLDQRRVTAASIASQALALIAVAVSHDTVVLLAACAAFGFSVGNIITLPALIIGHEFDDDVFATAVGLSNAVCQFAFALAPALLGVLRDVTGGYGSPLVVCIALDVLASVTILVTRPPFTRPRHA